MHVYRIEYHEYEYKPGVFGGSDSRSDWFLTPVTVKYVMADNTIDAVDLLRCHHRGRIEIASIEHICKVDIKK